MAPKVYFHSVLSPAHVLNSSLPEARDIQCFLLTCAGNIKLFNKTIGVKVRPKENESLFWNLYRVLTIGSGVKPGYGAAKHVKIAPF